jgi:hypothetical protein
MAPTNGDGMHKAASGLALQVEGTKRILPDATGVFDAIARIGYEFEQAIADLVDNSIDAEATDVLIRFFFNKTAVYSLAVIDNGKGMDADRMDAAMAFGTQNGKDDHSLGKYGMGLKSASFSQCAVLTVLSHHDGQVGGRRWTAENVRKDWLCETIVPGAVELYLRRNDDRVDTSTRGTLVQWDRLDTMSHSVESPSKTIADRFARLSRHLGLVFHRFLQAKELRIRMDAVDSDNDRRGPPIEIKPLDPFPRFQAIRSYPKTFTFAYPGAGDIEFVANIWRRNASDAGFRLGGGGLAKRQGFYIYRNRRLIQPGGWNGLRNDAEVHTSLARVQIDIPPRLDGLFKPTVQKSSVTMPQEFLRSLRNARSGSTTFNDFLIDAERAYRDGQIGRRPLGLIPTDGVTRDLARRFKRVLGEPADDEDLVSFQWRQLPGDQFFQIDAEANTITLNSTYRTAVLHGAKGSTGDAPIVKTLLMLLCKDDMRRVNRVKKHEEELNVYNQLLVEAARSQW